MNSDLYIALEAMQCDGPSAVVIAGTGSMCAGRISSADPIVHTGGWGWLLGDEGSGFHIGWEGLRAALRGYEGSGPQTLLTFYACDFYGAKVPEDLLDIFYNPNKRHNEIAAFSKYVGDLDDPVAHAIVQRCAAELAETAKALLRKLPDHTQIGLWGGVFERCEHYRQAFLQALGMPANVLPVPPVQGAAIAAMRLMK
jgi:N-acetylglucosamine kinase-like BadF-type ATPase